MEVRCRRLEVERLRFSWHSRIGALLNLLVVSPFPVDVTVKGDAGSLTRSNTISEFGSIELRFPRLGALLGRRSGRSVRLQVEVDRLGTSDHSRR